jgi:hypothetical protein
MEAISFLALILLSLTGYCAGAVIKTGKSAELKPVITDYILVSAILAGTIYSRVALELNRWLFLLVWVIVSFLIGVLASWPRKLPKKIAAIERIPSKKKIENAVRNPVKKLWSAWQKYFSRVGAFQSRIVVTIIFFILVTPFALGIKISSDPLRLKHQSKDTHWLPKVSSRTDLEQSRRQY